MRAVLGMGTFFHGGRSPSGARFVVRRQENRGGVVAFPTEQYGVGRTGVMHRGNPGGAGIA